MPHDHDKGLDHDLPRMLNRRTALGVLGTAIGSAFVTARVAGGDEANQGARPLDSLPEETAGPFPGDGTNGPNVLTQSGVVRRNIVESFGDATGVAKGVPTTIELTLLDIAGGGTPMAGAAVYLWHCDREGRYSLYDGDIVAENYLRGVQEADRDGRLAFDTIFPAAYSGRWPHVHFEVYESLDAAQAASNKLRTSQLAIPQDIADAVYATAGYEQSVANMGQGSLDSDMVFADGYSSQLAKVTGDVGSGITLSLNVGV